MRRIPASCSLLTPRLTRAETRRIWLAAVGAATAGTVYALALALPYLTGPLVAFGLCLVGWVATKLPAHRAPRCIANDNCALSHSIRPVLRPVPTSRDSHSKPRTGDAA